MNDDLRYRVHDAATGLARLSRNPLWWAFPAAARKGLLEASTTLFEAEGTEVIESLERIRDAIDGLLEETTTTPLVGAWRLFGRRRDLRNVTEALSRLDAELQAKPRGRIPAFEEGGPRSERTRIPRQSTARNISAG